LSNEAWREEISIRPVGRVKSELKEVSLGYRKGKLEFRPRGPGRQRSRELVSEVVIAEEYSECLEGLGDFSHAVIIYWSHLAGEEGRTVKSVHPAGQDDMPLVGVFATRSPARPNPLCVTTVEVLERSGIILRVKGLDAIDGSPVIDIKPHHPYFDAPGGVRLADWMVELMKRMSNTRTD
jgi:tRNA-Thr(GGU) m(6)t(6)A37 methyltransferase TsaA